MSALLDTITTQVLHAPVWLVLLVVGGVVFVEDALFVGFVVPGETVAILGGVAASMGHVPLASVLAGLLDMAIAIMVLFGLLAAYGVRLSSNLWALPAFVLLAVLTAFAVGLWLSALNVRYRDVRHAVPFLVQFWLFVTPVAYSSGLVPLRWRPWYGLNPMVGVVDGFRWALLGGRSPLGPAAAVSALVMLALLLGGLSYFRRTERTFADVV